MSKWSFHCCMCGQFVGWDADSSCYWGNSAMTEPPKPDYYCVRCAEKSKQETIERGYAYNAFWVKPKWQLEAIEILEEK